jgi:uncharacterized protein YjbJ (UPF0337 family)
MINQQTLQGNWHEIKGKLRSKWGSLTMTMSRSLMATSNS